MNCSDRVTHLLLSLTALSQGLLGFGLGKTKTHRAYFQKSEADTFQGPSVTMLGVAF